MYQSWKRVHGRTQMSGAGFVVPAAAPSGTPYVLTQTPGTVLSNFTGSLGMRMSPTATNTITELGRWVISGNNQSHTLYLMSFSGAGPWQAEGNCTINTSGATAGQYLYCTLASPVVIGTGMTYVAVLSSETSGGDQWYAENTTVDSVTAGIGTVNAAVNDSTPPTAPGVAASGSVTYGPVNFKVQ